MKRLVVFSGLDGAGKSTQIKLLEENLRANGLSTYYLWARGGYTPFFSALKSLLRRVFHRQSSPSPSSSMEREHILPKSWVRTIWLSVAICDMIFLYGVWLRLVRLSGRVIICDRYVWDTLVDFRLNFPEAPVDNWLSWRLLDILSPQPELVFLMLVPVAESIRRSNVKGEPFRDPAQILEKRLRQYQELARQNHWLMLDGCESVQSLAGRIKKEVLPDAD